MIICLLKTVKCVCRDFIDIFLYYAEDSSYKSSPDEWYVIKPFNITQKVASRCLSHKILL